ncbi:hypothetical protein LO762_30145 [Actinocorallia sp. API 0066]|uniref:hypothetical protein n=1 Tax=Actinocorallia sp. API 0066 TaxID=2896846 RepID=UPI001E37E907|nr:hypothetical protein [Actinocorallia sp. API 0066]MCD0453411.1 hypothetical protein [Actinocorallia sp. API 0066]
MADARAADRFDHSTNLARAGTYRDHRGAFWPPSDGYGLAVLDLGPSVPELGPQFPGALAALRSAVEAEWRRTKEAGVPARRRFNDPLPVAKALREVAEQLPGEADRHAATLRAGAVEDGYSDTILAELAGLREEHTVVAGQISTWFGKEVKGLPTAFACRADAARQAFVEAATRQPSADYLRSLHPDLLLGDVPAYGATELFFMAGEGDLHPKHIAYFLPEDEGVKYSPFKKTYYFANTHAALLRAVSAPLHRELTATGADFDPDDARWAAIPTLGVLGHEFGHFVHRPSTDFTALNAADRWVSVTLQEVAADVFGALLLTEVWAEPLGYTQTDALSYYLAECLRYVSRGLGHFPDSDGMYLQLSYFQQLGALTVESGGGRPVLTGDPEVVLAGLRSLARVLADTLLAGDAAGSRSLYRAFGPATPEPLAPLVAALRDRPLMSVEYTQEHLYSGADRG